MGPEKISHKIIKWYREGNAVKQFLEDIIQDKEELVPILTHIVPIKMTFEDEENFKIATHCNLCHQPLFQGRCKDHDHLNEQYWGYFIHYVAFITVLEK